MALAFLSSSYAVAYRVGSRIAPLDALTVACWGWRVGASGSALGRLVDIENVGSLYYNDSGSARFALSLSTTNRILTRNGAAIGAWAFIAASIPSRTDYLGQSVTLCVNGSTGVGLVNTAGAGTPTTAVATNTVGIGNAVTGGRYHNGYLAHAAIWARALSAAEMSLVYLHGPYAVPFGLAFYLPAVADAVPLVSSGNVFVGRQTSVPALVRDPYDGAAVMPRRLPTPYPVPRYTAATIGVRARAVTP